MAAKRARTDDEFADDDGGLESMVIGVGMDLDSGPRLEDIPDLEVQITANDRCLAITKNNMIAIQEMITQRLTYLLKEMEWPEEEIPVTINDVLFENEEIYENCPEQGSVVTELNDLAKTFRERQRAYEKMLMVVKDWVSMPFTEETADVLNAARVSEQEIAAHIPSVLMAKPCWC
jgi:hypothetical protein